MRMNTSLSNWMARDVKAAKRQTIREIAVRFGGSPTLDRACGLGSDLFQFKKRKNRRVLTHQPLALFD
jgi:ubiquinone/menaquinone biosynthesis C-methylase UbiE